MIRGWRACAAGLLAAALLASCASAPGVSEVRAGAGIAQVATASGPVLGYEQGGLWIFKGLPYASAARFQAPQPPAPWKAPRSTRAWGPVCPQDPTGTRFDPLAFITQPDYGHQAEDCLNLNIWTPGPQGRRPVMVWLHGGAYATGSSHGTPNTDGANLARRGDVVVVSLNHRLNVLGFTDLSLLGPRYADSANAGLLDIVAALRWVQQNIAAFGGDPGRVTIFGQSGGGSKVADLMTAPAAAGLFHRAIAQSTFRERLFTPARSRALAENFLARLQLDPTSPDTADRLARRPYAELLAASQAALDEARRDAEAAGERFDPPVGLSWGPTHDGRLLPWQPGEPDAAAQAAQVPLLVGSTHHEFAVATRPAALRGANATQVLAELQRRHGPRAGAVQAAHAAAHPGWPATDWLDTDVTYRQRAVALAERHARAGAPVWRYLFDWASPVLDSMFAVGHGAEIPFVFDNIDRAVEATGGGAEARALAARVSAAWLAFARDGDPRGGWPDWTPFTLKGGETLEIGARPALRLRPDADWLCVHRPGCVPGSWQP